MKQSCLTLVSIFVFLVSSTSFAQSLSPRSRGNAFNPAVGLNALTLFKNTSRDANDDGFELQEVELQLTSDVDAYF
tara:strand:- start:743 stop:970 length:228 start_codon:yes stop_codon:yes gene_type:complete